MVDDAVPSIFSFSVLTKKRCTSEGRSYKQQNKSIAMELIEASADSPVPQTEPSDDFGDDYPLSELETSVCSTTWDDNLVQFDNQVDVDPFQGINSKYFIVDIEKLKLLFDKCIICTKPAKVLKTLVKGTMLSIDIACEDHHSVWSSQFQKERINEGNMAVCAGILLSGSTNETARKIMELSGISFLGKTSFYDLQNKYLFPAINHVFTNKRNEILVKSLSKELDILEMEGLIHQGKMPLLVPTL